ncbi:MAG UNVERIFIED_CONTAM: hypothetical protein LVR18_14175 [Planctomycetaceae bacterium]
MQSTAAARSSDFFLSVWVSLLLELGRLPEAQAWFEEYSGPENRTPLPSHGRPHGADGLPSCTKCALEHFNSALDIWPGAMDWSLLHFKAQSLARVGRRQEADQIRVRAKEIELLMELPVHQKLRKMLLNLKDPATLREMENFYRALGRSWEADEWSQLAADLPSSR